MGMTVGLQRQYYGVTELCQQNGTQTGGQDLILGPDVCPAEAKHALELARGRVRANKYTRLDWFV